MRLYIFFFMLLTFPLLKGQHISLKPKQIQQKCDSILAEANKLYEYEKLAWSSTDLVREKRYIINQVVTYIVYQEKDTLKSVFINEEMDCVYELSYLPSEDVYLEDDITRSLNEKEIDLFLLRDKILTEVFENDKYDVICPDGYNLNMIFLPFGKDYKLYILTGTSLRNIIPFTNDYLFIADKTGKIKSGKKFHQSFLPAEVELPDGSKAINLTHSHLHTEPFISATDICTFKLYAPLYNIDQFSVYSGALSKYFIYHLTGDFIEIKDLK